MSKIAFLGDETASLAFMGLGVRVYRIEPPEALQRWSEIKEKFSIILMTETIYREIKEVVDESKALLPAVLIIPDAKGSAGLGLERMKKLIEKAVGVDILSKKIQG